MIEQRFLITAFGTLIYFDHASKNFRHMDVTMAPRNALFELNGSGASLSCEGHCIKFDTVMSPGGAGTFAGSQDGRFFSARLDGDVGFFALRLDTWEKFLPLTGEKIAERFWQPQSARGGTELMIEGLKVGLGVRLAGFHISINGDTLESTEGRPVISWVHNDINVNFGVFSHRERIDHVRRFIFVSQWQMNQFIEKYNLPLSKCRVLRNAIDPHRQGRQWDSQRPWRIRCAYTSAPYRGLDILLDAWEEMSLHAAELHVWSSIRLWGPGWSDGYHAALLARARDIPGVIYHGIMPNEVIRDALRDMHFFTFPTMFRETFCLAAAEAMAAGCRVVAPNLGAIPETTAGFAHIYPCNSDREANKNEFKKALQQEILSPWGGNLQMARWQRQYVENMMAWETRAVEWNSMLDELEGEIQ